MSNQFSIHDEDAVIAAMTCQERHAYYHWEEDMKHGERMIRQARQMRAKIRRRVRARMKRS